MKLFHILFTIVLFHFYCWNIFCSRIGLQIYGGNVVDDISMFPFMAQLLVNDRFECGGVIVDASKVITAAHCIPDKFIALKVRVGSLDPYDGGVMRNVSKFKEHPQFDQPHLFNNDIAVLILDRPLNLSTPYIKKISMAEPGKSDYIYENMSSEFMLAGYGATERTDDPTNLRWLQEQNFNITECAEIYINVKEENERFHITENMFCSGNEVLKFTRKGDSGGPVTFFDTKTKEMILVGIISFSETIKKDTESYPDVHTKISRYYDWINNFN